MITKSLVVAVALFIPAAIVLAANSSKKESSCYPTFSEYTVNEVFTGKRVPPNINQSYQVHSFRTVIREGSEGPPNFAGHYRIVQWGCGSPCVSFAVVDQKTGYVYMSPVGAVLGVNFEVNSSLFVIDPSTFIHATYVNGISGFPGVETFYVVWDSRKRKFKKIDGCNYGYITQLLNSP